MRVGRSRPTTGLYLRAARYQDQGGQFVTSHMGERGGELDEPFVGENLRMTEIAGAIAGVQLGKLPGLLDRLCVPTAPGGRRHRAGRRDGARRIPDPDGEGGSSLTWFLPDAEIARRFAGRCCRGRALRPDVRRASPSTPTRAILERRTASMKGGPWHCAEHPTAVEYRMGLCPRTEDSAARSLIVPIGPHWSAGECAQAPRPC